MPLPLTVSCFSKSQIGSTFLVPAHVGSPGTRAVKCVCVCVWSGTTRVGQYQKKHSPTHPSQSPDIFINFLHILRSIESSVFSLRAWQSFLTTSLQVLFGLGVSTSHIFTQSLSSFRSTCPYQHSLFCCNTNAMSSIPSLYLSSLLGNLSFSLMPHIHLTILISARWSATTFSFLTGLSASTRNSLLYTVKPAWVDSGRTWSWVRYPLRQSNPLIHVLQFTLCLNGTRLIISI